MLTVPGLCWLCKMPLALSAWGICSALAALANQNLPAMWFTGHKSLAALRPLPEKIPAVASAGGGG